MGDEEKIKMEENGMRREEDDCEEEEAKEVDGMR